jgi:hypothetical protein
METCLLALETPYTMLVGGSTGAGKSFFVNKLVKYQKLLHTNTFDRIVYVYSIMQDGYTELVDTIENFELVTSIPDDISRGDRTLLILDDQMLELGDSKLVAQLFTKLRHNNISTIFVVQNIFHNSKYMRTINVNSQYIVMFNSPRDKNTLSILNRQIFPDKPKFLTEAFADATKEPYGYIFLDLKPSTNPKLRVRTGILPNEQDFVYVPK